MLGSFGDVSGVSINIGIFYKSDASRTAWTKTGNFTATTGVTIVLENGGKTWNIPSGTSITMVDAATTGRDYYIYLRTDGTLGAYLDSTTAPVGGRKVGGFHYAPGGNAAAQAGGDTTPSINQYSFWDLKWKPSCPDPRGMALIAGTFWADIYLLNANHVTAGLTSTYNATIAKGGVTVQAPTIFGGGNYTGALTWFQATEVMVAYGKRLPTAQQYPHLAYGTTEKTSSGGTDVPTTGATGTGATSAWNVFTSKWGIIQATGCVYSWAQDWNSNGATLTAGWTATSVTQERGAIYQDTNASVRTAVLGGGWNSTSFSGSRASYWGDAPSDSASLFSARGVCDHLVLV